MAYNTNVDDIPLIVEAARAAYRSGKTRDIAWREQQLKAVLAMVNENIDKLCGVLKADLGANNWFAKVVEIGSVQEEARIALANIRSWILPKKVTTPTLQLPGSTWVIKEPLGTALIISAWNYPISLLLNPMIAAIAAGNSVVLKPSEVSVESTRLVTELIARYLDNEAIKIINGAVAETSAVLSEPFDMCFYTGSPGVGKIIMEACAKHLCPVVLELGGQCPAIVAKDANMKIAARKLMWGKFTMNTGQTCLSPNHIFVEEEAYHSLVDSLKETLLKFYGQDPSESKDYQRIINSRHVERLAALLEDESISVIAGGDYDKETKYFGPTLVKATLDSKCMKDEIFGPILPIIPVKDIQTAVALVNKGHKPLGAYVFSTNGKTVEFVISNTSSGGVTVNDCVMHAGNPNVAFGGVGNSGMGGYHGKHGFNAFTHKKPVLYRMAWMDDSARRYPPYSDAGVNTVVSIKHAIGNLPAHPSCSDQWLLSPP